MYYEPYVLCHYGVKGMKWYKHLKAKQEAKRKDRYNQYLENRKPEAVSTQTQRDNYARLSSYSSYKKMRKDKVIKSARKELKNDRDYVQSYNEKLRKQDAKAAESGLQKDRDKLFKMQTGKGANRTIQYIGKIDNKVNDILGNIGDTKYRNVSELAANTRQMVYDALDKMDYRYIDLSD